MELIKAHLYLGDCLAVMETLNENSVDSCVTDPPYHLASVVKRFGKKDSAPAKFGTDGAYARASKGFMGKEWDGGDISFRPETWAAVLRVLKPGGHLIAFSATRNYHRMACAIEDAGFEIRDQLAWMYGSGMPKSHNQKDDWEGWGTALKPAWEPIVLARKPFKGSIRENLETWGVGVLNIDGCRVEGGARPLRVLDAKETSNNTYSGRMDGSLAGGSKAAGETTLGRWPANILHDGSDDVVAAFPKAETARFFYCAKASRSDREAGLEETFGEKPLLRSASTENPGSFQPEGTKKSAKNNHPTVKPTELMRYLCRLVTPKGGLVLDPFMGSGSTGRAAVFEGFDFVGAEMEPEYMDIAEARIEAAGGTVESRKVKPKRDLDEIIGTSKRERSLEGIFW